MRKIRKKLGVDELNYPHDFKVVSNYTSYHLKKIFGDEIFQDERKLADVWHCLYFYDDEDMLLKKLEDTYELSDSQLRLVENVRLKEGYAPLFPEGHK